MVERIGSYLGTSFPLFHGCPSRVWISGYLLVVISEEGVVCDLLVAPPSDDHQQAQDGGEDDGGQQQLQLGAACNPLHVSTS